MWSGNGEVEREGNERSEITEVSGEIAKDEQLSSDNAVSKLAGALE